VTRGADAAGPGGDGPQQDQSGPSPDDAPSRPAFAHASEAELARILDFYQVRWDYEPDTFPIGWSMSGDVVESFSPDFYLPDFDLYVELTTLKQKLVRKKNRKLRRLRELYPDVRIKLFYARDFRMLLLKFGRLALADDLSGTTGQATPPRPADRIVREAGAGLLAGGGPRIGGAPAEPAEREPATGSAPRDLGHEPAAAANGSGHEAAATGPAETPRGRRRGRRGRHGSTTTDAGAARGPAPAEAAPGSEAS
jgi:hypothetical protein